MKTMARVFAVALLLTYAGAASATTFDGSYKFTARTKEGAADMAGWTGEMTIKGNEVTRNYKAPDGKAEKFYTSTMTQNGNWYVLKHTKAYKPEYVGNEHKNKFIVNGATLTMESEDGKFKEVWTKR